MYPETLHSVLSLLAKLRERICYELNLRADDNLNGSLTWLDDTGNACSLDGLVVHLRHILNLKSQSGYTVVDACDVLLAAAADCPVLGAFPLLNVSEMFRFFLASPL